MEKPGDCIHIIGQAALLIRGEISQALSNLEQRFNFPLRAERDVDVVQERSGRTAAVAFGDVGGNRDCRTAQAVR